MEKMKRFLTSRVVTVIAFAAAAALLLFASVGGARAALTYRSQTYTSQVQMQDIGVTLLENGEDISWRNYTGADEADWVETKGELFSAAPGENKEWAVGKGYPEVLSVRNSGTINQYVRVTVLKYWVDDAGNKRTDISPETIDLNFVNLGKKGWIIDKEASTAERTVLYYAKLLYADGNGESETVPFTDTVKIDSAVLNNVTKITESKDGYTTVTTTYDYNGIRFQVELTVDAVQEHSAQEAILSAWGRDVTMENGVLSLE